MTAPLPAAPSGNAPEAGAERALGAVRLGLLSYLNTLPFSLLDQAPWLQVQPVPSPRRLSQLARQGAVDAGPLPVADLWGMEDRFEPLGSFGIAVREAAKSVLLLSKRPAQNLDGACIGVTDQSSTSVRLLGILLKEKYGFRCSLREGFQDSDDARLLIGDDALLCGPALAAAFGHVMDLGLEWRQWQKRPFVFARWAVRRAMPDFSKARLSQALEASLRRYEEQKVPLSTAAAARLGLPAQVVQEYLGLLVYRLGEEELAAERAFRRLAEKPATPGGPA